MSNKEYTSLNIKSMTGYYLDDVNNILDQLDNNTNNVYRMKPVINKEAMKAFIEYRAINDTEGTNQESLGYSEVFDRIEKELDTHVDTYKYYLSLYKYYSRVFNIDKLLDLKESLKEFYNKTHFMSFFPKIEINTPTQLVDDELLDILNSKINSDLDLNVGNLLLLKEAMGDKRNQYGIQHLRMYKALKYGLKSYEILNSKESIVNNIYKYYLNIVQ